MDIYDTVLVLRTQEAVNAFAHPKVSIGAELSVAAGPLGSGGALDMGFKDKSPAWVYTKSKGFYAGIQLDGTVVIERNDETERFYGRKIKAAELIKGAVRRPGSTDGLIAAIEMAEGTRARFSLPPGPSRSESDARSSDWESNDPSATVYEQPIAGSSRHSEADTPSRQEEKSHPVDGISAPAGPPPGYVDMTDDDTKDV